MTTAEQRLHLTYAGATVLAVLVASLAHGTLRGAAWFVCLGLTALWASTARRGQA